MVDLQLLSYLEGFISEERKQRFVSVLAQRTRHLTVAVEDVFQLHNSSAVVRSCEVFGLQDIHLIEGRFGGHLDRKIAMGAQRWVDIHRYRNPEECISELKNRGYRIVATTPDQSAGSLEDFRLDTPSALFFGTEKDGLSKTALAAADDLLCLPMAGFTESLNISVAAGIILYHLSNKLRQTTLPWQLSETEILEKKLDWTIKSIKSSKPIIRRYYTSRQKPGQAS